MSTPGPARVRPRSRDAVRDLGGRPFGSSARVSFRPLNQVLRSYLNIPGRRGARVGGHSTGAMTGFRKGHRGPGWQDTRDSRVSQCTRVLPGPKDTRGDCPRESCHVGGGEEELPWESRLLAAAPEAVGCGGGWGAQGWTPNPAGLGRAPECSRSRPTPRTPAVSPKLTALRLFRDTDRQGCPARCLLSGCPSWSLNTRVPRPHRDGGASGPRWKGKETSLK